MSNPILVTKDNKFVNTVRLSTNPIKNTDYEEDTVFIFNTWGMKRRMNYMIMSIIIVDEPIFIRVDNLEKQEIKNSGLYRFDISKIDLSGNRDFHITGYGKFILANIGVCDKCFGCTDEITKTEIIKEDISNIKEKEKVKDEIKIE